jgi:deoxyribodipyrimidine photo-lyase
MVKKYNTSIFIFRRDLRLDDNIGLMEALKQSKIVIPIFIFTSDQILKNDYKSDACVKFMVECLDDLNLNLKKQKSKLNYFYGDNAKVIKQIIADKEISAVFLNQDYTPYSVARDEEIKKLCEKEKVDFNSYEDILLNPVNSIKSGQDEIFVKFTPYFNKASKIKVADPIKNKYSNYSKNIKFSFETKKFKSLFDKKVEVDIVGGRKNAIVILKNTKKFKNYNKERNTLITPTTNLSAYIKFGSVSIREVYYCFKKDLGNSNDLIKQLYWRDFYYNIVYNKPFVFKGALKERYNKIKWNTDKKKLDLWKNGQTGFPIIDAAMTEMNKTGFMHNRARLIVASFLVKIMLINWQEGEKYFAQKLVDYDPSVNNGNWQWIAGSGADAQPYFRIFNPWAQAKTHDAECEYIKKWLPVLKDVPNAKILAWDVCYVEYPNVKYSKPILNYADQKKKALAAYKKIY